MYMRFARLSVKPERRADLREFFAKEVEPKLRLLPGCLCAGMFNDYMSMQNVISLTLWQSAADAATYESTGYPELLQSIADYLVTPIEWKVQLTHDLTVEFGPVDAKPEVEIFTVVEGSAETVPFEISELYLRFVSATVRNGHFNMLRSVYTSEVIPILRKQSGFRYAFLAESTVQINESLSVTMWEDEQAAYRYEQSGQFTKAVSLVRPVLSDFQQWRLALDAFEYDEQLANDDPWSVLDRW